MRRLRWYLFGSDGRYDTAKPVWLELPEHDYDYLADLRQQLERVPPGTDRYLAIANELRTNLDLRARFPGGAFVVEETPPSPVPPAYRRRVEEAHEASLFDEAPLPDPEFKQVGAFPTDGPDTSRQAAMLIYPSSGNKRRQVLDAIGRAGDRGLIDDEGEQVIDMLHTTYTARRGELEKDGWIVRSGRHRRTRSGNDADVWVLSAAGQRQWKPKLSLIHSIAS